MGAETTIWVEVEVPSYEWRETHGVTSDDALRNVVLVPGERVTGRTSYEEPQPDAP